MDNFFAEVLSFYKFPGDEIPIVQGSSLSALHGTNEELGKKAILKLMEAVDACIVDPVRQLDKPFTMSVDEVFSIQVSSCIKSYWSINNFECLIDLGCGDFALKVCGLSVSFW